MFDPFLFRLGPLGVALILAAVLCAVAAPVLWDLVGRLLPELPSPSVALRRAREHARAVTTLWRERIARVVHGSFVAGYLGGGL